MTITPTAPQVIAKGGSPVPQEGQSAKRRSFSLFSGLGQGKEIRQAVGAVCMGEEGAPGKFMTLYASLDPKGKARALEQLAKEFEQRTNELTIDADAAIVGANIADALEQLAVSGALKDLSSRAGDAMRTISDRLSDILEDRTEDNVYTHVHADLRPSCARAASALMKDMGQEVHEGLITRLVVSPQLQDWALEVAFENGYQSVIEQCCGIESLVPKIIDKSEGRTVMVSVLSSTENGERAAIFKSISNAGGPGVMPLLTKLVEDPKMAVDVLACAAVCRAVTLVDEASLVALLVEKGEDKTLKLAMHREGTMFMTIRWLVGSEKGDALVMSAVEEAGTERAEAVVKMVQSGKGTKAKDAEVEDEEERGNLREQLRAKRAAAMAGPNAEENVMLRILAAQGEPKIGSILAKWSAEPGTRGYFFRTAAMLKAASPELQHAVFTFTEATQKSEIKAARAAFGQMMRNESQRKIEAFDVALRNLFEGMSGDIGKEPGKERMGVRAFADSEGMRAEIKAIFQYEQAPESAPGPEEDRQVQIAVLRKSLEAKQRAREQAPSPFALPGWRTPTPTVDAEPAEQDEAVEEPAEAPAELAPEEKAEMKIVALERGLNALRSVFSDLLLAKPRLLKVEGIEFGAQEGVFKVHAKTDLEFHSE